MSGSTRSPGGGLPAGGRPRDGVRSAAGVCSRCSAPLGAAAHFCASCGSAVSLVGRVLDRYRLVSEIGAGGMGRVFKGEHVELGRVVAVKLLAPELLRDETMVGRFRREARAAGRLSHPNIVATLDVGVADEHHYLVMEYVDGPCLETLVASEGPLSLRRALELGAQVASALGAAHAHGIVHRDVKPANVLVARVEEGRELARVADFGLAQLRDAGSEPLTGVGVSLGTPAYMAPEQILARPLDARADVYGLGGLLVHLLTGEPPFGRCETSALLARHLHAVPDPPSSRRAGLPPAVDALVLSMLAKSPERRPVDGSSAAAQIRQALRDLDTSAPARAARPPRALVVALWRDATAGETVPEAVSKAGGAVSSFDGEELIAHFDSVEAAVRVAAGLRRGRPAPALGVDFGSVVSGPDGVSADAARRLARLALPGEALVSTAVQAEVGLALLAGMELQGELRSGEGGDGGAVFRLRELQRDVTGALQLPVVEGRLRGTDLEFDCTCGARGLVRSAGSATDARLRVRCPRCSGPVVVVPGERARSGAGARTALTVDDDLRLVARAGDSERQILRDLAALDDVGVETEGPASEDEEKT